MREWARNTYRSQYMQCVVSVLIMANFLVSLFSAQYKTAEYDYQHASFYERLDLVLRSAPDYCLGPAPY